jgi:hypothetical protein
LLFKDVGHIGREFVIACHSIDMEAARFAQPSPTGFLVNKCHMIAQ